MRLLHWLSIIFNFGLNPLLARYEYTSSNSSCRELSVWFLNACTKMDNQCSRRIQKYITSQGTNIKLLIPDDHGVNAAERAIQTWKNYYVADLSTTDPNYPLQLWCQFIPQAQDTLNMLWNARVKPKLSLYAVLEGQFKFNKTPLAPVGTKALVFLDQKHQKTFNTHAVDAFYVVPAMKHYRNYRFFIPETGGHGVNTAEQAIYTTLFRSKKYSGGSYFLDRKSVV